MIYSRKIHVLGSSTLGQLVAHALRTTQNQVTIHFHRLRQPDEFNAVYGITVKSPSGDNLFRDGFGYEMKDERMLRAVPYIPHILEAQRRKEYVPAIATPKIRPLPEEATEPPQLEGRLDREDTEIDVLIIAKKGGEIHPALSQVKHRLKRKSTIVVLHNGMGVLSQVQSLWSEHLRPNILEGYSSHGITKVEEFTLDHWGQGIIHMAIAPRLDETDIFSYQSIRLASLPPVLNSRHVNSDLRLETLARADKYRSLVFIIQQLLSNKVLNCTLRAYLPDFYLMQLRRTILHSILQNLGSLQGCTNAELIENRINKRLIGKLFAEIIPVLRLDPLISSSISYLKDFSFRSLYAQLLLIARMNPNLTNAMQQDIAGKRELELNYHSGYLLRLARQRALKMPTWRIIHELVKSGARLQQNRYNQFVPVGKDGKVKDLPEWMKDVPSYITTAQGSVDDVVKERYEFEELEEDGIEDMESMDLDDSWETKSIEKSQQPTHDTVNQQTESTVQNQAASRDSPAENSGPEMKTVTPSDRSKLLPPKPKHEIQNINRKQTQERAETSAPVSTLAETNGTRYTSSRHPRKPYTDTTDTNDTTLPPTPTKSGKVFLNSIAGATCTRVMHQKPLSDTSNQISPTSHPTDNLPVTLTPNGPGSEPPSPNPSTPQDTSTTSEISDQSTPKDPILAPKASATLPYLLQRLQTTSTMASDDLNQERQLISIRNLRIKPKRQPVSKPETVNDNKSKDTESMENDQSSGSEDTIHERKVEGNVFHTLEVGDSEMTTYIMSTMNSDSNKASNEELSIEDSLLAPKLSDTELLLQAMRLREISKHPHIQSDNSRISGQVADLKEEPNSPGSAKNTPTETNSTEILPDISELKVVEPAKKRRGRPLGSKNKDTKIQ